MLVLSRKVGQSICIGNGIVLKVASVSGNCVRFAIDAPVEIPVHRAEVYQRIHANFAAQTTAASNQASSQGCESQCLSQTM
ncbi:MAG: carbon storage regulator [Planctomycetota bacterium]|nr:carbon storage regulator [Planctomycetota bacterium]